MLYSVVFIHHIRRRVISDAHNHLEGSKQPLSWTALNCHLSRVSWYPGTVAMTQYVQDLVDLIDFSDSTWNWTWG
jgi:hypothetical protein